MKSLRCWILRLNNQGIVDFRNWLMGRVVWDDCYSRTCGVQHLIHRGPKLNITAPFGVYEAWNAANLYWEGKFYTPFTNSEMDYLYGSVKILIAINPDWFYDGLCMYLCYILWLGVASQVWVSHMILLMGEGGNIQNVKLDLFSQLLVIGFTNEKNI